MALNQFNCTSSFGNTGIGKCSLIPSFIVGMFLVPNNLVITEANAANLQTFLEDKAKDSNKNNRIYPVHNFVGMTDNSEEAVSETTGYGFAIPLRDGNYSWTFRFVQGGICLLKELQKFNHQNMSALFIDSNGVVYGRNVPTGLAGVPLISFYAGKWTLSDSSTIANFAITVTFDPKHLNQDLGFIKDDNFIASDVVGLQSVNVSPVGSQTTTVLNVSVAAACGGENLFDLYSTELADGSLWNVLDSTTGAALTVSSVAANAANKSFAITVSATRSNPSLVSLKDVATLEAADIFGVESNVALVPLT